MPEIKKKILVIDDSSSSRLLYKTVLSNENDYEVSLCGNLKQGMSEFPVFQPDLIVLDMQLPDGTGIDFLKHIREKNSTVKVMVISAVRSSAMILESAKLGIGAYLIKPIDIKKFLEQVREFLKKG